jgi:DNA repair exonuclease SbcCD ATPase subunit
VAKVDHEIDALYQAPPGEFTAARNALAKTLTGDAARQVKALKKPTVVPWAVNQVFWKARAVYDRVMERGRALRTAQIASLKGRKSDVRSAMEAHRKAVGEAVHRAQSIAADAGLNPDTDQLARMFEALSLAASPPEEAGRFVEAMEPMGFEALSGVTPAARATPIVENAAQKRKAEEKKEAAERQAEEAEARLKAARRELERAGERVSDARKVLKQAESDLAAAQAEVDDAQSSLASTAATIRSHRD